MCILVCFFTVFDDEEESKLSYTEIYQEYQALVSIIRYLW